MVKLTIDYDYVLDESFIIDNIMQEFDEEKNVLHEDNLLMDEGIINLHWGFYWLLIYELLWIYKRIIYEFLNCWSLISFLLTDIDIIKWFIYEFLK